MNEPTSLIDVIRLLRTSDVSRLYFMSQHMAAVLEDVARDLAALRGLVENADEINMAGLADPLTRVSLVSMIPDYLLHDLLGVIADGVSE